MSVNSRTIKSPNPAIRVLMTRVGEVSFAASGGIVPPEGTLYGSEAFRSYFGKDYQKEFKNFVYTGQGPDDKEGGTLLFAPNMTEDEANIPFRTTTSFKLKSWPAILIRMTPIPVRSYPISTQKMSTGGADYGTVNIQFVQRYKMEQVYIPEQTVSTKITVEEFTSPRPFNIPKHQTPVTDSVIFQLPTGEQFGFPSCLHKKLTIPKIMVGTGSAPLSGSGGVSDFELINGQVFQATNFPTWLSYYESDEQTYEGGIYYRRRVKVHAPPLPKPDRKISN